MAIWSADIQGDWVSESEGGRAGRGGLCSMANSVVSDGFGQFGRPSRVID